MKRVVFLAALLFSVAAAGSATTYLDQGEALFVANKPQDARPFLETALGEDPGNEKIYLYLGIVYQQLGDPDKAIEILKRGLGVAAEHKELFYYNMGNNFFSRKEYTLAEEMYTNAVAADGKLAEGYLNRANARLQLQSWDGALTDYTIFLQLRPQDAQRPRIEEVIRLLQRAGDEREKMRQEELAKQKALMNDVLNSLNNAGEDTKNVSVESIKARDDPANLDIKD